MSLFNLAVMLEVLGRFGEAETLFREAVEIDRKRLHGRHKFIAGHLFHLGILV